MKRKLSLILAFVLIVSTVVTEAEAADATSFNDFSDINPQYVEAVTYAAEKGILSGYNDNTFRPQYILNRGAAAKIISIIELGANTASALVADGAPYPDVPENHVFAGYIAYCSYNKYINGYSDGTFRPIEPLTAEVFAKMLLNAIGYSSESNRYIGNSWKNNVREDAIAAGIFSINMDFKTDTMISREQAAWMVYNALNWDGVRHDTITIPEMKPDSQLLNIKTAYDLQEYLNKRYANGIDLPIGHQAISFTVTKNDRKDCLYDYNIKANGNACRAVDTAENLITYSENDITKSRDILKSVQVDVYQIASQAFPDAKLSGGYTWREYKYKYIQEDLFGWAWDSWTNYNDSNEYYLHGFGVDLPSTKLTYSDTYITAFHWCPKADGYFD